MARGRSLFLHLKTKRFWTKNLSIIKQNLAILKGELLARPMNLNKPSNTNGLMF